MNVARGILPIANSDQKGQLERASAVRYRETKEILDKFPNATPSLQELPSWRKSCCNKSLKTGKSKKLTNSRAINGWNRLASHRASIKSRRVIQLRSRNMNRKVDSVDQGSHQMSSTL